MPRRFPPASAPSSDDMGFIFGGSRSQSASVVRFVGLSGFPGADAYGMPNVSGWLGWVLQSGSDASSSFLPSPSRPEPGSPASLQVCPNGVGSIVESGGIGFG